MRMSEFPASWKLNEAEFPNEGAHAQLIFCLRYALLAPSSHNSQPWFFRAQGGELSVFADRSRALPVVDPEDRELVISCGALIGQLSVALTHFGLVHEVTLLPDRNRPDLMARIALAHAPRHPAPDDDLFHAILERRTVRLAYESRPVPREAILAFETEPTDDSVRVRNIHGETERRAICDLVEHADRVQLADRRFRRELAAWVHSNRSRVGDGMPASAIGMGDLASSLAPTILRTFDVGGGTAARDRRLVEGSPVLVAIVTNEDSTLGLAASFLNQPIEVPELRPKLRSVVGSKGEPQLLLRIGYGPRVPPPTPRRPLEEVLLD
jgi:hypothetical protein